MLLKPSGARGPQNGCGARMDTNQRPNLGDLYKVMSRDISPYKCPYKWASGVITWLVGVTTPFMTGGRGPPCRVFWGFMNSLRWTNISFCQPDFWRWFSFTRAICLFPLLGKGYVKDTCVSRVGEDFEQKSLKLGHWEIESLGEYDFSDQLANDDKVSDLSFFQFSFFFVI